MFHICKLARKNFLSIFVSNITEMKQKVYTPAQFAKKNKISRTTVWRWLTKKGHEKRLKMYDAKKISVAGKDFIEQTIN